MFGEMRKDSIIICFKKKKNNNNLHHDGMLLQNESKDRLGEVEPKVATLLQEAGGG